MNLFLILSVLLIYFILGVMLFVLCVVFHELGHYYTAKKLRLHPILTYTGTPIVLYFNKDPDKDIKVLSYGIVSGLYPIIFFTALVGMNYFLFIITLFYLTSCLKDITFIHEAYHQLYHQEVV